MAHQPQHDPARLCGARNADCASPSDGMHRLQRTHRMHQVLVLDALWSIYQTLRAEGPRQQVNCVDFFGAWHKGGLRLKICSMPLSKTCPSRNLHLMHFQHCAPASHTESSDIKKRTRRYTALRLFPQSKPSKSAQTTTDLLDLVQSFQSNLKLAPD